MTNPVSFDKVTTQAVRTLVGLSILAVLVAPLLANPPVSHAQPSTILGHASQKLDSSEPAICHIEPSSNACLQKNGPRGTAVFIFIYKQQITNLKSLEGVQPRDYNFQDLASKPAGTYVYIWLLPPPFTAQELATHTVTLGAKGYYAKYLGKQLNAVNLIGLASRNKFEVVATNVPIKHIPLQTLFGGARIVGESPKSRV